MVSQAAATDRCSVYTAKSAQDFLDHLLTSAEHWNSASRGDLAYRGQASSQWALLPKAFRANELTGYQPNAVAARVDRVGSQARAEFRAVHQFVKAADLSGLQVTEAGARLLLEEDPREMFRDHDWESSWPRNEVLESIALAQHHGVPTRLLDFTEDPLVGAFFAAYPAWDPKNRRRTRGRDRRYLAVWVIDMRFIRALNNITRRYPERIGEVHVPRANNSFLHAQAGFFLVDRGANDVMTRGGSLCLDHVLVERADHWHNGNRLASRRIERTWFDEVPVRKVRLPTNQTAALLSELESRGITRGSLMPSLDRVVESLEFQRSFASIPLTT